MFVLTILLAVIVKVPFRAFDLIFQDCVKCVVDGLKQHGANIIYGKEVGEVKLDGDKRKVNKF